jgi:hypothetical protein
MLKTYDRPERTQTQQEWLVVMAVKEETHKFRQDWIDQGSYPSKILKISWGTTYNTKQIQQW